MLFNKNIELKNKHLIFKLVKNHFSLDEQSLNIFKHNLFYERDVAKEYSFIHEEKDLRKIYPLEEFSSEEVLIKIYPDYKLFKSIFIEELDKLNIKVSYNEFKKNILNYEKNNHKLIKFLFKQKVISYLRDFVNNNISNELEIKQEIENFSYKTTFKKILNVIIKIREKYDKLLNTLDYQIESLNMEIENLIKIKTTKSTNLKLVISRNFTDYFLCSTNQPYRSCINLNSDYDGAYWTGLPGLITDKNRSIMYITDESEIDYEGIIAPKMMSRSWIILARSKRKGKEERTYKTNIVRMYPSDTDYNIFKMFVHNVLKEDVLNYDMDQNFKGRYYFDPIWFKDKKLCHIYQDSTKIKKGKKNKAKYTKQIFYEQINRSGHYQLLHKEKDGISDLSSWNYDKGLTSLINNNNEILDTIDLEEDECCEFCDSSYNVNYYEILERYCCNDCYSERISVCDICGREEQNDDLIEDENGRIYCTNCADRLLYFCGDCNTYSTQTSFVNIKQRNNTYSEAHVCNNCLNNYVECVECGELFDVLNNNNLCNDCQTKKENEYAETN